jgi:hypothetical protein
VPFADASELIPQGGIDLRTGPHATEPATGAAPHGRSKR